MTTQQYKRPATSAPVAGEAGLPNRDKFQAVSATRPRIPISSEDIDSEINNLVDAVNELYDTAISGTVPDNSVTLAKLSHLTAGSMYYMDGTGTPSELAIGSSGEVLSVSGGVPSWAAVAGSPTAGIMPYAGSSAPSGWLLCDGSAVSRTTYADLFAAISTTYGVGDGSTTFNLPDLRGNVPLGLDNMGGTSANRVTDADADTLGGTLGSETEQGSVSVAGHALTTAELPAHTHQQQWPDIADSDTNPSVQTPTLMNYVKAGITSAISKFITSDIFKEGSTGSLASREEAPLTTASTGSGSAHTHSATFTGTTGANVQPSLALNYIIKT